MEAIVISVTFGACVLKHHANYGCLFVFKGLDGGSRLEGGHLAFLQFPIAASILLDASNKKTNVESTWSTLSVSGQSLHAMGEKKVSRVHHCHFRY